MASGVGVQNFEHLLTEVVIKIFDCLSVEERQVIRGVSHFFHDLIDEAFGMKVVIRNSTSDLISTCPFAVQVDLSSMTIPFQIELISFAETLERLTFSKILVTYNLISFLKACYNIRYLAFVNIVLDQAISDPWSTALGKEETIPLAHLKTLELKCFTFVDGVLEIFGFLDQKVTYGCLEEVSISVQNPPVIPLHVIFARNFNPVTTHPLLKLLRKNRNTLRKFVMGRTTLPVLMIIHPPGTHPLTHSPSSEELPPQLETLEIHPYFREEWAPLLRGQTRIRILDLGSCNVTRWGDIQGAISANAPTLQSFSIGGLSFGQNWNCSVFQNCFALKDLSLEISHSSKVNLRDIPASLRNLHLFGPISKAEMISISEHLLELETLKFTHLGRIAEFVEVDEDKMSLDVFKCLLQLPKLKLMSLLACSSVSIDWDGIVGWCEGIKTAPGFDFTERYYQLHGENFRNGISVKISDEFRREEIAWTSVDENDVLESPLETLKPQSR